MIIILQIIQIALLAYILVLLTRPRAKKSSSKKDKTLILDSCALIDGRIVDIVNSGFAQARIVIPRFIVSELQMLADGNDSQKRERARFGLDVAQTLQNSKACEVVIVADEIPEHKKVDDKLVALAKKIGGDLYTTDYNLNKVASIEGVSVLNVNELAGKLRPIAIPGETKSVKIIQKGSNKNQGVGYLEDGTMVVVDGASKMIDKTLTVEISRIHQTDAGKMLFASIKK